jgi:DNA-binding NtrC family response regulator
MIARVILAVQEPPVRRELRSWLAESDVVVKTLSGKARLWDRAARETCDLVVVSRACVPEPCDESVQYLRELPEAPEVVVLTDEENPEERAGLLAAGAAAVLDTDLSPEAICSVLETILDDRRTALGRDLSLVRDIARPSLSDFVSASETMGAFMRMVQRVVPSDTTLLILGETGVGKERLARAIHAEGRRGDGPFVTVNCGALPESLLESELFGHEQGAFTGASRARRGLFELAHEGTIFLDEIGEMPYHLQVKLLRVLQEHEIQPIGNEKSIAVDVRVMAASNRDLEADVEEKQFRRDLYYRISVVTLTVPPLRERREDIPELVESYIQHLRPRVGREVFGITDRALDALCQYSWPGNVRELINVIERAMLLCDGDEITRDDLPGAISGRRLIPSSSDTQVPWGNHPIPTEWLQRPLSEVRQAAVDGVERAYLTELLRETEGRVGETAKRAGIQPRSLYDKMQQHGLRKEDFRRGTRHS